MVKIEPMGIKKALSPKPTNVSTPATSKSQGRRQRSRWDNRDSNKNNAPANIETFKGGIPKLLVFIKEANQVAKFDEAQKVL